MSKTGIGLENIVRGTERYYSAKWLYFLEMFRHICVNNHIWETLIQINDNTETNDINNDDRLRKKHVVI